MGEKAGSKVVLPFFWKSSCCVKMLAAAGLAQSLKHPGAAIRDIASDALVGMGSFAVRPVVQVLGDPNEGIQMIAEAVFLRMGPEAVSELRKADEVPDFRPRIEKTLRQIQEARNGINQRR